MKTTITKAILFFSFLALQTKAQNTFPSTGDVGIGTTAPDARLKIFSRYSQAINCGDYNGVPGLKIERIQLQPCAPCFGCGSPTNNPPNIVEVVSSDPYSYPPTSSAPNFIIRHDGRVGIGTHPLNNNMFSVSGNSFFTGNTQVQSKFRINSSGSLSLTDWSSATFPYTFSVDNGNSRFMGNIELNGDLIIKGINSSTIGNNQIRLSSNGYIRAREIKVDYDNIPDYVFKPNYYLMPLLDLEKYIAKEKHLPNIKSENEYNKSEGINLGELNLQLLEKVEELTLYSISLQKQLISLQNQLDSLTIKN